MPITLVAVLFGVIFTFTDLIVVFVLTRGGPYDTTQVLASWAFFTGIQGGDLAGGAASIAVPVPGPGGGGDHLPADRPPRRGDLR